MKIEIKNIQGVVLFSHECEGNTIKNTVELAVNLDVSLSGADLSGADLIGANLIGANLSGANLTEAYLTEANLSGADLIGADLRGAYLLGAIGNMKEIWSMQVEQWQIIWTKEVLQIGCRRYSLDEWRNFSDEKISAMNGNALSLWKKWKEHIFKTIEMTTGETK